MVSSPLVKLGPIWISLVGLVITLALLKGLQAPSSARFDAAPFLPLRWVYFVPFPISFLYQPFKWNRTSLFFPWQASLSLPLSIISPSSWLAFFSSALKSLLCLLPESAGTMKSGIWRHMGVWRRSWQGASGDGRDAWKELWIYLRLMCEVNNRATNCIFLLFIPTAKLS